MTYKSDSYWQQQADYIMNIDMDVETYQYTGTQKIIYTNNSPDELNNVFYHLYFNAFQPGSEMDARVQSISDPDKRLAQNIEGKNQPLYESRIAKLQPNEIGYLKVISLSVNGKPLTYKVEGTILEVHLDKGINPGEKVEFDMVFRGQVPLQIRRSGRNSKEGVALSMGQWYPKLAEYDDEGWHADPYIGREFYGVWGDYDVKIAIDKHYTIGGTGYLQNPEEIGHGYAKKNVITDGDKLVWHFKAPNVHDFSWAADPDYRHDTFQMKDGPMLHFLYKKDMDSEYLNNWKAIQSKAADFFEYYNLNIGLYPYQQYSIIQAGDGGMEYGMCTFITGERSFNSLLSVVSHEIAHNWFQFVVASNESKHEWMDEGLTSYIEDEALNVIKGTNKENAQETAYERYVGFANSGYEQPLTTHADRYASNKAYSRAAYSKGAVFLSQLRYIIGEDQVKKTIKKYYRDFAFKHPKPFDIIRTAEKVSGLELDWYFIDFAQTTNTIDYGIKTVDKRSVTLERIGLMPMPIDITITYTDDTQEQFYIPLRQMRGEKPTSATILSDWAWAYPTYSFETSKKIKSAEIDPSGFMADVDRENNTYNRKKNN
ncbi:M1 family metallopeptidase [Psychroserpens sp. XS_ASV72]|uniref:M1 family metallopeptidase n=1 Tax=Psychroserpens sp. XS_ASV72 TaxID=3241293 RepID=UPI0035114C3F